MTTGIEPRMRLSDHARVAVVIPAYRATSSIMAVLSAIGPEVELVYVVDDACPDHTGAFVTAHTRDPRVHVVTHEVNRGVGGAVMTGYTTAMSDGANILIKLDSDGQMDPHLIPDVIAPILAREADYTKGNRFVDFATLSSMPFVRKFGNGVLSLMTKLSSGYWDVFDPTNGYTAIAADVLRMLPLEKISSRYFFESDMLFRLSLIRAVVVDVPMVAEYGDESSGLRVSRIAGEFLVKHMRNFFKRIVYNYYVRDVSLASIQLPLGIGLFGFGSIFGGERWMESIHTGVVTPAGTVMLAALPVLMGMQLLLAFLAYDIASVPKRPRHRRYRTMPVRSPISSPQQ